MKKNIVFILACVLIMFVSACGKATNSGISDEMESVVKSMRINAGKIADELNQTDYQSNDERFLCYLQKALETRYEIDNDSTLGENADSSLAWWTVRVETEAIIMNSCDFTDAVFNDDYLGLMARDYIDGINAQVYSLQYYESSPGKYREMYNNGYRERANSIKVFVDNYGFTVDSRYQAALDDLLKDAKSKDDLVQQENDNVESNKNDSASSGRTAKVEGSSGVIEYPTGPFTVVDGDKEFRVESFEITDLQEGDDQRYLALYTIKGEGDNVTVELNCFDNDGYLTKTMQINTKGNGGKWKESYNYLIDRTTVKIALPEKYLSSSPSVKETTGVNDDSPQQASNVSSGKMASVEGRNGTIKYNAGPFNVVEGNKEFRVESFEITELQEGDDQRYLALYTIKGEGDNVTVLLDCFDDEGYLTKTMKINTKGNGGKWKDSYNYLIDRTTVKIVPHIE